MLAARTASPEDGPELLRLRRLMFRATGDPGDDRSWHDAFLARWQAGDLVGAVVDLPGGAGLVCSAIGEIRRVLPGPGRPEQLGYISSVATDPAWRRRGLATSVVALLLARFGELGITRVELHATTDGQNVYQRLGFVERPGVALRHEAGPGSPVGADS